MLTSILIAVALGSVVSLIGGIALLGLPQKTLRKAEHLFVALAAGALLGAAALDLLPEALEISADVVPYALLLGISTFLIIERGLSWLHHHRHEEGDRDHKHESTTLVIIGDTIHNFIDGAAIAISFMASPELGILTAIAVGLHEIPQEVGDFALMLSRGFSKKKALLVNVCSALAAFLGAGITYLLADSITNLLPWLLAGTAGMFMYISLANLIPDLHREHERKLVWLETLVIILGIAAVALVGHLAHDIG